MVLQGVAAEDEKDVATPFGVVGGLQIKDDGDQILDVLHGGGLAMKVSDGRGLRGDGARVVIFEGVVAEGLSAKPVAQGRGLSLQGVSLRALRVESSGGGADAFLGGGGRLEKVRLLLKELTALGVGGLQSSGLVFQFLGGGDGFIAKFGRCGGSRGARARGIAGGHGRQQTGRAWWPTKGRARWPSKGRALLPSRACGGRREARGGREGARARGGDAGAAVEAPSAGARKKRKQGNGHRTRLVV